MKAGRSLPLPQTETETGMETEQISLLPAALKASLDAQGPSTVSTIEGGGH